MTLKKFHGGGFGDDWRVIFYAVGKVLCMFNYQAFHILRYIKLLWCAFVSLTESMNSCNKLLR